MSLFPRALKALVLAALLSAFAWPVLAAKTFLVNSTGDKADQTKGDGICADADGNCSLRAAIEESNALAGTDTISFAIPGAGVHTITPLSALPFINDPVIIDGTTQLGYAGTPVIELNGTSVAPNDGIVIFAGSSTVRALSIGGFGYGIDLFTNGGNTIVGNFVGLTASGNATRPNQGIGIYVTTSNNHIGGTGPGDRNVVSGNGSTGIALSGSGATGNFVQANLVGTDATGTLKRANGGNGIHVDSAGNTIGGAGAGNLVSGNTSPGIFITGVAAVGNHVEGNVIGLDVTVTTKLGNAGNGVVIDMGGSNNFIGGTAPGTGNVISGNSFPGIAIVGPTVTGNSILGNSIGTNPAGATGLGNDQNGILIRAPGNFIGGTTPAAANVIAGNAFPGVFFDTSDAHDNLVQGNRIGVNAGGASVGNSKGIVVNSAPNNLIGGAAPGAGNIVSGNTSYGIEIRNGGSTGNTVKGNFIGTLPGDTVDRHNGGDGILINATTDNVIGGTAAAEGNAISHNLGNGVTVTGSSAVRNAIRGNAIRDNTGLGIDLGGDGVTPNDQGDGDNGPNDLMNFPEGVTATWDKDKNQTVLRGHVDTATPATGAIDLFANSKKDASDHGQGEKYLGTATPDSNGFFCLTVTGQLPFVAAGPPPPSGTVVPPPWVSATATSASGSTSEFSPTNNPVELIGLEVTQAVQDWTNSVPMIKKKQTYVRAHIQTTDPASAPINVSVQLRGLRNGVELPGSPLSPVNFGAFQAQPNMAPRRMNFNDSVNFRLPDAWLDGTLELRLERTDGILACKEAADASGPPGTCSDCRVHVTFEEGSAIPVEFVNVSWTDPAGAVHEWDDAHIDTLVKRLVSIYPVDDLPDVTRGEVFYSSVLPPRVGLINGSLENRRMLDGCLSASGCQRYYYGVVKDANIGGRANGVPGTAASGEMPANPLIYGRNRHAHEIGHLLNRAHAVNLGLFGPCLDSVGNPEANTALGPCNNSCASNPPQGGVFPYFFTVGGVNEATLGPLTSGEDAKMFGLDTSRIPGPIAVDPRQNFELMSYCGTWRWISDFTYKGLHTTITNLFPPSVSTTSTQWATTLQDYLLVRGAIDLRSDAAQLAPVQRILSSPPPDPSPPGPYTLELRDGSGGVLSQIPFGPRVDAPDFPEQVQTSGRFLLAVPFDAAIRGVRILHGANVLASRTASPNAPAVQVVYPNGGENLTQDPVVLQWSATDTDGDPLTFVIQYSSDGGSSWKTLATDWPSQTLSLPRKFLKGTGNGLVRVIVSDGFNTASDQSNAVFSVGNHAPSVTLFSPSAGQSFAGNQQIVFEALARDIEDGVLSGSSLQWTSSIDGPLGSGATLLKQATQLSPGNHTITVTATDSASLASQVTVAIAVGVLPPASHADLSADQSASPEPPRAGSLLTLTITVTNGGRDGATGVTLTDTLPAGASFGSASASQGSCVQASGTVTCSLGSFPANAEATVTIIVTPSAPGSITNTASVAANEADPVPANNLTTELLLVEPAPPTVSNPAGQSICAGASAVLSATGSGQPPLVYRWRKNGFDLSNGGSISGSATATLTINPAAADDSGAYDLVVTDGFGQSATSTAAGLTVTPLPSGAVAAPAAVCGSRSGNHAFVPSAGTGATYAWTIGNGAITSGAGTNIITFTSGASGTVTLNVTVSNSCGIQSGELDVAVVACAAEPRSLLVDPSPDGGLSDGNGMLEAGETAVVKPSWRNSGVSPLGLSGSASNFAGPAGAMYVLKDSSADYGSIPAGATNDCSSTGNCYEVSLSIPATRPATHWDATLTETLSDGDAPTVWPVHIGQSFTDVPKTHTFYQFVERILHNGVTTGCTGTSYCPDDFVFRLQMAVFIARAQAGADANVPASGTAQGQPYNCASGGISLFSDVLPTNPFCRHVHYIYSTNVTTGCEAGKYCPDPNVTRAQMALFISRAIAGSDAAVPLTYGPDPVTGRSYSCNPGSPNLHFTDVTTSDIFCRATHYLWAKDVISGFPDNSYGPNLLVSRGAMAKFLANGFNLRLYGP